MDLFLVWSRPCWPGVWIQFITSSIFSSFTHMPGQIVAKKISPLDQLYLWFRPFVSLPVSHLRQSSSAHQCHSNDNDTQTDGFSL